MRLSLIAPCGMNCRLCRAYIREPNACPGCRADDADKPKTRLVCRIKTCERIANGRARYCSGCDEFPCNSLAQLDKRYRTKYGLSMIENLNNMRDIGIRSFVQNEKQKWACPACGNMICVHVPQCLSCGRKWR